MVLDALLTLAYPQICGLCDRSVEQRRFGVVCESCWKETRIFTDDKTICWKCGLPAAAEVAPAFREQVRCRRCDSLAFTAARAAGPYEGALRESVLLLKRQPHASRHVEDLLVAVAMRAPLNETTRVIPVPLHRKRMRARGFNQAWVLAQALSKRLGLPLDEVSLERVAWSEKYRAGLDVKGRRETVAGAFELRYPRLVAGERILLVDDVFTTGATVSACAEVLIAAGAANVYVITAARA
jgi:ComF family protein